MTDDDLAQGWQEWKWWRFTLQKLPGDRNLGAWLSWYNAGFGILLALDLWRVSFRLEFN